jgi:hypothetical protein
MNRACILLLIAGVVACNDVAPDRYAPLYYNVTAPVSASGLPVLVENGP